MRQLLLAISIAVAVGGCAPMEPKAGSVPKTSSMSWEEACHKGGNIVYCQHKGPTKECGCLSRHAVHQSLDGIL